jgi:hypothetical protein
MIRKEGGGGEGGGGTGGRVMEILGKGCVCTSGKRQEGHRFTVREQKKKKKNKKTKMTHDSSY